MGQARTSPRSHPPPVGSPMVDDLSPMKAVLDRADRGDVAELCSALQFEVSCNDNYGWLIFPSGSLSV